MDQTITYYNNLGIMYEKGQGVAQDYVSAHMWFNLAAITGDKTAVDNREIFAKKMTWFNPYKTVPVQLLNWFN